LTLAAGGSSIGGKVESEVEDHPGPTGTERKLATVLFADLVGSTARAGVEDPERTRATLERFYSAMTEEIETAGGTVEKFAGDAVMAVFGVPAAQEDHVERALHASLAMRRRLERLFGEGHALRIGVNCGEVVVGRAREQSSFVSGDVVNVAARLEQLADPGDILVGERAARIVSGAFELEAPQTLAAKGKPEGIPCRKLVRALSLLRPRGVPGLRSPFVGREPELARMQEAYERCVSSGDPQLVTVVGEAGVGKTRLARELWQWLGQHASETLRRTGRCPPYGRGVTYQPLADILKEHFAILDSDPPERILECLGGREILALTFGLDVSGDLHPVVARDRLHDAWIELARELASERPLVVLVEDLHWAEEPLVELLERMLLEVDSPALLVGTARPEFLDRSPSWGRGRVQSEWLWLEPLAPGHVRRLLEESVKGELPPEVDEFLGRAEGNPLFVEELIATLIERRVLQPDGEWNLDLLPQADGVPESVQSVLASRIDLLPPAEKQALQAAAVVGRAFWPSAVRELLDGADPDFRLLEQRDFVRRRTASSLADETEFVFKHAITRDVAYGSLTMRDRTRLHAGFAAWLEERGGGRDEHAALLALHYAEAARPENADLAWGEDTAELARVRSRAVEWLRRAAELAGLRCEVEDALALLDQALALAGEYAPKVEILREIARTHSVRYDPEGVRAALEQALGLEPAPAVAAEIYAQLAYYALTRRYMWKEPPESELAEEWLARALELSQPGTASRAYALLARASSKPGQSGDADEAYETAKVLNDQRLVLLACEVQTIVETLAGRYGVACEWAERALEAASGYEDPSLRAHQFFNATLVFLKAGRISDVAPFVAAYDRLTSSLTAHDRVHAMAALALVASINGSWAELVELAGRVEAASERNEDFPCQFNWRNLLVCALGLAHAGEDREAGRLEQIARESAVVFGPPEREPALLRLSLLRGDDAAIRETLEALPATGDVFGVDTAAARLDALVALEENSRIEEEAPPHLELESYTQPFALRALGVARGEPALIERSASRFEEMDLDWRASETRALLDS
jgi:class 3 adenylate cyclase/tetratricopeptide (TPR) repeat protein